MARRAVCGADGCDQTAAAQHYLCDSCWRRLPLWLCRDIAKARVTGATGRAEQLRTTALTHLRGNMRAYAQIATLLGERDAETLSPDGRP